MTSALSPLPTASLRPRSTPLALLKPEGLAAPDAGGSKESEAASAPTDAAASTKSGTLHGGALGGASDGGGGRHVVDERVTESATMRITVISYSDGSVDRLSAIKAGASASAPAQPSGASGWGQRGMMVDRVG